MAFVGLALASLAIAQLAKYKDWPKSSEAYFLTPAEREEWSKIKSDEEAEKFISLYWAKRGTRFRDEVSRRIAAADEQFKMRRQKGSESVRGRLLITLGPPSRVLQERAQERESVSPPESGTSTETLFSSGRSVFTQTWVYEKDRVDPAWNVSELRVRISVDPQRGSDELTIGAAVERVIAKVAEKSIVNPSGGTVGAAPAVKPVVPAAATGPAVPPAPVAATLPAATRSALEALLKEKKGETSPSFWAGPFRSIPGESFYALQFYIPGDKAPAAPVKFGGVVVSESGEQAASYWEDAILSDMKTGARIDKVFERSVVLPAGGYRGAFGLFPSDGGAALASAQTSFRLAPKSNEFDVSPLILGNTLTPLTKRPGPTDPFVFGMEKPIRVEPKANRLYTREDGLWYFYTVSNPAVPPASAEASSSAKAAEDKSAGKPAATPAAGTSAATGPASAEATAGRPAPTPAPAAPKPRIMARISVLKEGQPAFQPMTAPAELQILGPGYYASGSEIPLVTFEPGYYTFTLNVRDLNAPKDSAANSKGFDRKEDFVVLKPDGTMPEKAAAKPSAQPAPKPTAPKPKAGKKP